MEHIDRPVVIGGGAAGLAACLTLQAAGMSPLLLEASDRLGGRLRTEQMADGTRVDVGFQVLLTAYPELKRWVDMSALEPVRFVPGARIHKGGRWRTLADPRRRPGTLPATLTSGIGTWADRFRMLRLVLEVMRGSAEDVQSRATSGTALDDLKARGFSEGFIRDFLQSFFSGIFLDKALTPPPAQFLYTLRMFASGDVVRPAGGVEALVHQLQGKLERTEVRLQQRVVSFESGHILTEHGADWVAPQIICTVPSLLDGRPPVRWHGCLNVVFATSERSFGKPIIGLLPEAHSVTNFHFMEDVQGAEGQGKLNATAVLEYGQNVDGAVLAMQSDLRAAGLAVGEVLWKAHIPEALPAMREVRPAMAQPKISEGLYIAGDATAAPSLDAALRSGRVAAEALIQSKRSTTP
ncbi:MAG: FAD-binding protein [Crocinitomicaceae bacterium TMED114]|nr:MAG: FAD-binding protein [Crocinitomicaceae bacterium TMED114]